MDQYTPLCSIVPRRALHFVNSVCRWATDFPATDDAALVERVGGRVMMVESSGDNLKITRPEDLEMAELMLSRSEG